MADVGLQVADQKAPPCHAQYSYPPFPPSCNATYNSDTNSSKTSQCDTVMTADPGVRQTWVQTLAVNT